jgi:hypothetical protein
MPLPFYGADSYYSLMGVTVIEHRLIRKMGVVTLGQVVQDGDQWKRATAEALILLG